jgi:hypothetical protein
METIHIFGTYQHLFGVHSSAVRDPSSGPARALLMLSAGILPCAGPMRLHARLARSLAQAGIPSFRFDLSGIGESLGVGSYRTSLERAAHEASQAMDLLAGEYGYREFLIFGLCSGADDAIPAALDDGRVVGLSLVDACGYRTSRYSLRMLRRVYVPKVLSLRKWGHFVANKLKVRGREPKEPSTMSRGFDIREFPDRNQAEEQILVLLNRGVHMQFVYTAGVIHYYSYASQFFDMFPRLRSRSSVEVSYCPRFDHVLMLEEDRSELVERVTDWASRICSIRAEQASEASPSRLHPFKPHDSQGISTKVDSPRRVRSKGCAGQL